MYFRVNFEVHSGYGGPFLSILVRSGAFLSIPVSKRTRKDGILRSLGKISTSANPSLKVILAWTIPI